MSEPTKTETTHPARGAWEKEDAAAYLRSASVSQRSSALSAPASCRIFRIGRSRRLRREDLDRWLAEKVTAGRSGREEGDV